MKLITLDLGATTGWCEGDLNTGIENHGTVTFKAPKEKGKWQAKHFLAASKWAFAHFYDHRDNAVLFCEKPNARMPGYDGVKIHFGLHSIISMQACGLGITDDVVSAATIKKYWTGNGKADKDLMVEQTQNYFPEVTDDNESDAIALWMFCWDVLYNKKGELRK